MLVAGPEQVKPSYRVPSMAEIAALPWNGFTVASTFSGAGGSCLGYRMAGYRVVWASEFVPIAADSYRANAPETILDTRDIRAVTAAEILVATGLQVGELDLLDGSPPCQPFSTAGKREKTWGKQRDYGDHSQRADDLFFEYARLVRDLQPRTFVAENVSGLVKGTAKGYFKEILAALKACGYAVSARLLDAQWLGVPQMRQRIIFVGVRADLGFVPEFPTPLPYRYSVRDALPWIDRVQLGREDFRDAAGHPSPTVLATDGQRSTSTLDCPIGLVEVSPRGRRDTRDDRGAFGNGGEITNIPAPTVLADSVGTHWIEGLVIEPESSMDGYAVGRAWDRLAPGESTFYGGGLVRPDVEQPCPTITAKGGDATASSVTHPIERRKFSIAELRRICAFPDDFVLCGSYAEQWARLGNAVPPLMMRSVAETIRDQILLKVTRG